MYASLTHVDIISTDAAGNCWYVLVDPRTPTEIAATAELSTIFAVLRVLNALDFAASRGEPVVCAYFVSAPPPEFLIAAVEAAGGQVQLDPNTRAPAPAHVPALEDLLQSAFAALAQQTAREHSVALNMAGLEAVEQALTAHPADPATDTLGYWTTVVRLGALAGEVIRASNGGHWIVNSMGTLPVALTTCFEGKDATVNPLGKAIKRLANGPSDSVSSLARVVTMKP